MRTNLSAWVRAAGRRVALGLLCLPLLAAGCGGPPRAQVQGTVTLDGVPVESGTIEFCLASGNGPTAAVGIGPGGQFAVETTPGQMVVKIEATKVVGQRKAYNTPDSPMIDIVASLVPPRYNRNSELKVDLKPGENKCNFDLKTK